MNRLPLVLLFGWCLSSSAAQIPAGIDSAQVVILSDRVGPVIDSLEREHYRLFLQITRFKRAVVLQLPDTTFVIRFTVGDPGGRERDTLVTYGGPLLRNLAERIEHFEEILAGTYRTSDKPAVLRLATGAAVVYPTITTVPAAIPGVSPEAPGGSPQHTYPSGLLPLAPSGGLHSERNYPFLLDFGFGLRTFSPDLQALSRAFGTTPPFVYSPMVTGHLEIAIIEILSLQAEAGTSLSDDGYAADAGIVFYIPIPSNRTLRPYLAGGFSWCSVSGSYSGLNMVAGAKGYFVSVGFDIQIKGSGGMDLFGGYRFFPEVSTMFWDDLSKDPVSASIDFSGPTFGFRLKILQ
jgi:hypothetical protein